MNLESGPTDRLSGMLIRYFLTDNPSWDNPLTIKNHINIIPSCTWDSPFDHLKEPTAICRAKNRNQDFNSLDLQGIIYPHEVTSNLSKADPGFLTLQEEIMLGPSSAEESLASQLLPLPLITCSSYDPEPAKGDHLFSSKRKRKDYSDRGFRIKGHNSEPSSIRYEPALQTLAQVKEIIYRAAALRPVNVAAEEAVERPKRKNVRISDEPQTVAARHRRERISEKLRVLQRLVPGGNRMDTASMLDEAANYIKFLKAQVIALEGISSMKSGGGVNGVCSVLDPIQLTNSSHYCLFSHRKAYSTESCFH